MPWRKQPLNYCAQFADFAILGSDGGIERGYLCRMLDAFGTNGDPIQIAAMLRIDDIAGEHILADVCAIEDSEVIKRPLPSAASKRYRSD